MTRNPSEFGSRLRERRRAAGLSQGAVADVVGVNRRVISELERGKPTVQLGIALRVAEALGLDVALTERGR
jgi:HTH-type transcriptional regulator / antitoxin HipB